MLEKAWVFIHMEKVFLKKNEKKKKKKTFDLE
jgi:hypothetical protein